MSEDDVKKNKSIIQKFVNGKVVNEDELKVSVVRLPSLYVDIFSGQSAECKQSFITKLCWQLDKYRWGTSEDEENSGGFLCSCG